MCDNFNNLKQTKLGELKMMTKDVRTILNKDRSRELKLVILGNEIEFTLSTTEKTTFNFTYSSMNPFSVTKPWKLFYEKPEELILNMLNKGSIKVEAKYKLCKIKDVFSFIGEYLYLKRKWEFYENPDITHLSFGTSLLSGPGDNQKVNIPHVIYNGNPSASELTLVPRLKEVEGYSVVVEEHRLPIPAVNVEWENKKDRFTSFTLFSVPSQIFGKKSQEERWWSSGVVRTGEAWKILNMSGIVALNNMPDIIHDNRFAPVELPGGGYINLQKDSRVFEKELYIDLSDCREGRGFKRMFPIGWEILRPKTEGLFGLEETIRLKKNAMLSRWVEGEINGFVNVLDSYEEGNNSKSPPAISFGWTGQNLRLAWCAFALGIRENNKDLLNMGNKVMDTFSNAPYIGKEKGLKFTRYDITTKKWVGSYKENHVPVRAFGEAMSNFCDCILLLRANALPVKDSWLKTVKEVGEFLCKKTALNKAGIYPLFFTAKGTPADELVVAGGAPCVSVLLFAYEITGEEKFLKKGLEILERYYLLFGDKLRTPFSHSTLDAKCEDKEAGLLFFIAAYKAFLITGNPKYKDYAQLAVEWSNTFVYLWDPGFIEGTLLEKKRFKATFWPGVSVQNIHLDVFFYPYEVYQFGKLIGNERWVKMCKGMMKAWTHGICRYPGDWGFSIPGQQGEQFYHTNNSLAMKYPPIIKRSEHGVPTCGWRGGFNPWSTSWIIASVLQSAIRFLEEEERVTVQKT